MLRRMFSVDNWLDVAPLENMGEDHRLLFLKKNLTKIFFFFFLIWKSWIFSWNWKFWLIFFFFFWKQPKKYEPNAPSPKALFENFLFFFFFFFFWNMKICWLSKKWRRWRWRWSKGDEDLFLMDFFFFFLKNLSFKWE